MKPATISAPMAGNSALKWLLVAGDAMALTLAWWLSAAVVDMAPAGPARFALLGVISGAATMAVLRHQGLYLSRVCSQRVIEARGAVRSVVVGGIVTAAAATLLGVRISAHPDLAFAAIYAIFAGTGLLLVRTSYRAWLSARRRGGTFVRSLLVVGSNEEAANFIEVIGDHPELGYRVAGVLGDAPGDFPCPFIEGPAEEAVSVVRALGATGAVVVASALSARQLRAVTRALLAAGIHVQVSSGLSGLATSRVHTVSVAHEPLLYLEAAGLQTWQRGLKRCMDVVLGLIALVASSPLWLLVAACIKVDSSGPVIFSQERIGMDGHPFRMLKFRTMAPDAEGRLSALRAANERTEGPLFKMSSDPRVTRVGGLLRATSLDELPQLLNVLAGTMSLVGPRPAMAHEVEKFDDELKERLREKPGITGLWQIEARDHPSFNPYRRLDLFYVENWSLTLDLLILIGTVTSVSARTFRSLLWWRHAEAAVKPL